MKAHIPVRDIQFKKGHWYDANTLKNEREMLCGIKAQEWSGMDPDDGLWGMGRHEGDTIVTIDTENTDDMPRCKNCLKAVERLGLHPSGWPEKERDLETMDRFAYLDNWP